MKYLLDTNICIYVINARHTQVVDRFRAEARNGIGVSVFTACELAFGAAKSGSMRNRETLEKFLAPIEVVPFDEACVWRYGELRADLERAGRPIGSIDTLIAAHALAMNATLVTNNTSEFSRVPGLRCENWIAPAA